MYELDLALMKRDAERVLRGQGRSLSQAKREVGQMSWLELRRLVRPTPLDRVKSLFG